MKSGNAKRCAYRQADGRRDGLMDGWIGGKVEGSLWGGGRFISLRGRLAEYLIKCLSCCFIFDESRGHG